MNTHELKAWMCTTLAYQQEHVFLGVAFISMALISLMLWLSEGRKRNDTPYNDDM